MRIKLKVHGTLGKYIHGYDHVAGHWMDVPEGTDVTGLMGLLGIPIKKIGFVSIDGKIVDKKKPLADQMLVKVFQPVFGG